MFAVKIDPNSLSHPVDHGTSLTQLTITVMNRAINFFPLSVLRKLFRTSYIKAASRYKDHPIFRQRDKFPKSGNSCQWL